MNDLDQIKKNAGLNEIDEPEIGIADIVYTLIDNLEASNADTGNGSRFQRLLSDLRLAVENYEDSGHGYERGDEIGSGRYD